mmetsp:Transcript_59647/g.129163  ORF Transcript_59647/g.129163 Transcript_59647/m.129163 type:complete len:80 (+) Transcript_59647:77-316(+)
MALRSKVCSTAKPEPDKCSAWLLLGYHPAWQKQIKRAVASMGIECHDIMAAIGMNSKVNVAWKNMMPPHVSLLRKASGK